MKSKLTRKIEKALMLYRNVNKNKFVFIQPEVPGIDFKSQIDVVRFEDLFGEDNSLNITCYEIKISLKDFNSKNGHNFVGNQNYYVVPREIYSRIITEVPKHVGIILFNDHDELPTLRRIKDCIVQQVDDAFGKQLLFNAIRRYMRDDENGKHTMNTINEKNFNQERYHQLTLC